MAEVKPLTLSITCPQGVGEVRGVSAEHPMVAPYRKAIAEGSRTGEHVLHLYAFEDSTPILFGSLLLTEGLRLLFFPGGVVNATSDDRRSRFRDVPLDHITLEKPSHRRYSSHFALRNGKRVLRMRGVVPTKAKVPFFSLIAPNLKGLVTIPRLLEFSFPRPRADVQKFGQTLMIEGGTMKLPIPQVDREVQRFFQLDVWVGRNSHECQGGVGRLPWALMPALVRDAPIPQQLKTSRVDHLMAPDYGLTLLVSRPLGTIKSNGAHILRARLAQDYEPSLGPSAV
jgi:hypothetical protein